MNRFLTFIIFLIALACQQEDCITIEDKQIIDGKYYFLFNDFNNYTNNPNETRLFVPDNQQSGQVTQSEYNQYNIGDTYCY